MVLHEQFRGFVKQRRWAERPRRRFGSVDGLEKIRLLERWRGPWANVTVIMEARTIGCPLSQIEAASLEFRPNRPRWSQWLEHLQRRLGEDLPVLVPLPASADLIAHLEEWSQ